MRYSKLLLLLIVSLITAALLAPLQATLQAPLQAQDATQNAPPAATCGAVLDSLWANASNACINKPGGYVCNGGAAPAAEPAGLVGNALAPLGALVDVSTVHAIRTAPIAPESSSVGVAWLRLPDPLGVTILMLGDVTLFDVTPANVPAWTTIVVQTNAAAPGCDSAPRNVIILQSAGQARLTINGSTLQFSGTVLVASDDSSTIFIGLDGQGSVQALGQQQTLFPGAQINVAHPPGNPSAASAAPSAPTPLDDSYLNHLPVSLFDRPLILPQPGFASTQGATNLRVSPDIYSGVITQVPGGQPLTILGRNPDSTWYHIRLRDGETGWMLATLLAANLGTVSAVYSETPLPPQRLGELGTRARVHGPTGVNLRRGPDVTFPAIAIISDGTLVDLIARSPLQNGWVKVNDNGTVGWLSLLTLETQAYIDALPIDYSAPALPTATPIPGSSGNAYPVLGTPVSR